MRGSVVWGAPLPVGVSVAGASTFRRSRPFWCCLRSLGHQRCDLDGDCQVCRLGLWLCLRIVPRDRHVLSLLPDRGRRDFTASQLRIDGDHLVADRCRRAGLQRLVQGVHAQIVRGQRISRRLSEGLALGLLGLCGLTGPGCCRGHCCVSLCLDATEVGFLDGTEPGTGVLAFPLGSGDMPS